MFAQQISDVPIGRGKQTLGFDIHMDDDLFHKGNDTPKQLIMSERKPLSMKKHDKKETAVDPLKLIKQVQFFL